MRQDIMAEEMTLREIDACVDGGRAQTQLNSKLARRCCGCEKVAPIGLQFSFHVLPLFLSPFKSSVPAMERPATL